MKKFTKALAAPVLAAVLLVACNGDTVPSEQPTDFVPPAEAPGETDPVAPGEADPAVTDTAPDTESE